jgi:hypothetical protein
MSITREEIRQLCIEHDRFMAEQASETIRRSPVSESGGAGIIYKEYDNSPLPPAAATAEGEQDWSGWEAWMAGHLAVEREHMLDSLAEAMMMLIHQERDTVDRKLAELRAENAELKGMIGTVLRLYAGETKTGDVVDLPDWRKRDAA